MFLKEAALAGFEQGAIVRTREVSATGIHRAIVARVSEDPQGNVVVHGDCWARPAGELVVIRRPVKS